MVFLRKLYPVHRIHNPCNGVKSVMSRMGGRIAVGTGIFVIVAEIDERRLRCRGHGLGLYSQPHDRDLGYLLVIETDIVPYDPVIDGVYPECLTEPETDVTNLLLQVNI